MEDPKSLDSLFKEKLFRIPDYQRGYAWQPEQLKDFWEDLMNLSTTRNHYTGVLTLKQVPAEGTEGIKENDKEYWLVNEHSYDLYHIVDGQQRLTTFVIFLQAFVEFVRALPENNGRSDDDIFISDTLSIADVQSRFLFRTKPRAPLFRTYKFGYTTDNPSYKYLRYRIFDEPGSGSVQETFYTLNLSNAKRYFSEQLSELYLQEGFAGLQNVYRKLTKRFLFNEYIIKDEFDVFVAFETMNNRGKKLSDLELLKNRLIYLTTLYDDDELDPAGRRSLRDTINDAWKEVYYQLGRNKAAPLNDDDFLRAHWTLYFRLAGGNAANFLLNEQFTPQKVHEKIERDVALEVPEERSSEPAPDGSGEEVEDTVEETASISTAQLQPKEINDFVNSMKESVVHWFNTFNPDMAEGMDDKERHWIERLHRIDMPPHFRMIVTAILKNEQNLSDRIEMFRRIERFIFIAIRMTWRTSNYGASEFYRAASDFHNGKVSLGNLKGKLNYRLRFTLDEDGSFRSSNFQAILHGRFESGSGYYTWPGLRYFLYEYELDLLNGSRQKKVEWKDLLRSERDRITIEHIYPQTETEEWASAFSSIEPERRHYYNGSLGNLLLLSGSINSSLQNDSFANKKTAKYNGDKKVRNGYSDGSHSEIEVSRLEKWGPEEIRKRGLKLLRFMEERWDFSFQSDDREELLFLRSDEEHDRQP